MSIDISIRDEGFIGGDPLKRFQWRKSSVEWLDEVGPLTRDALKAEAPVGKGPRAGRLRDSIRYSRSTSGDSVRAEYRAHVSYAPYVIGGTRPHVISARAARALHWVDGSGEHFARTVHHPGTHPNDFPARALGSVRDEVEAAFRRSVGGNS